MDRFLVLRLFACRSGLLFPFVFASTLWQFVRGKFFNQAVVEIHIENDSLLSTAVFCKHQLEFMQVFDELFDVLPACLLDIVVLGLLR